MYKNQKFINCCSGGVSTIAMKMIVEVQLSEIFTGMGMAFNEGHDKLANQIFQYLRDLFSNDASRLRTALIYARKEIRIWSDSYYELRKEFGIGLEKQEAV